MDYYIYISDQKVDMLASQIAEKRLRAIARRLEISVTAPWLPLSATYRPGDPAPADEQRINRLRLVREAMDPATVGDLHSSGPWIEGCLDMRWGFVESDHAAVWFLSAEQGTTVVMGGSEKHLLGGRDVVEQPHHAYSLLPMLSRALIAHAESVSEEHEEPPPNVFRAALVLARTAAGPHERLRFLARKLAVGSTEDGRVVLGTPLYVELASSRD